MSGLLKSTSSNKTLTSASVFNFLQYFVLVVEYEENSNAHGSVVGKAGFHGTPQIVLDTSEVFRPHFEN